MHGTTMKLCISELSDRFILFLIYFPEKYAAIPTPDLPTKVHTMTKEWKTALVIAAVCTGHFAISFLITVILLAAIGSPSQHWETNYWAGILGILSMILASFQYLPQIWKTWKRKVSWHWRKDWSCYWSISSLLVHWVFLWCCCRHLVSFRQRETELWIRVAPMTTCTHTMPNTIMT